MQYIPEATIPSLVTPQDALTAVEATFLSMAEGTAQNFPVVREALPTFEGIFGIKSGVDITAGLLGLKAGGYWAGNMQRQITNHQSSVVLFDPATGQVQAVVGGNYLTALRTAAAAALSVKYLALPDANRLGVIGAGKQAAYHIRAICALRPIKQIAVWNRTPDKVKALQAELSDLAIPITYMEREALCAASDIIVTITSCHEPLLFRPWIRPGTHLACMGTDTKGKQEVDENLVAAAQVFTDEVAQAVTIGECQHAVRNGLLSSEAITPLGHVIAGQHTGRRDAQSITLYDGTGVALQDLAVARMAVARFSVEHAG